MHIGILQAGAVRSEFQPAFGDYPDMFMALLGHADQRRPRFTAYRVGELDYPSPEACDAYLITGSRFSVYEDLPWIRRLAEFVAAAMARGSKIVGICFGHQLVAHYFGGRTARAEAGWGVGVHCAEIVSRERWMDPPRDTICLLASHQDQVISLPPDARLIARSRFCPNAGFVIGGRVLTWQGHPEFPKPYAEALMRARKTLLGPETFEHGIASLREATHHQVVARWILNFLDS